MKQLIKGGFIEKNGTFYVLTTSGMLKAQEFDNTTLMPINKPLTMVTVAVEYKGKYLLQKRLKQPFLGYYGFPGCKVRFGETLEEAGKREFLQETGVAVSKLALVGIHHEMNANEEGETIRDAYVYVLEGEASQLPLKLKSKDGENFFIDPAAYKNYKPRFKDTDDFFEKKNSKIFFDEFVTQQEP